MIVPQALEAGCQRDRESCVRKEVAGLAGRQRSHTHDLAFAFALSTVASRAAWLLAASTSSCPSWASSAPDSAQLSPPKAEGRTAPTAEYAAPCAA